MDTRTAFFGLIVATLALIAGFVLFGMDQTDADDEEISYASELSTFSGTVSDLWPEGEIVEYDLEGPVYIFIVPDSVDGYDYEVYRTISNGLTVEVVDGAIYTTVAETGYTNIVLKRTDASGQSEARTLFVTVTTLSEEGVPIYGSEQDVEISITPASKTIRVGQSYNVALTISPGDVDNLTKTRWSTNNSSIASITNAGVFGTSLSETVQAVGKGTTTIIGTAWFKEPDPTGETAWLTYSAMAFASVEVFEGYVVTWMSQDGSTTLATTEVQEGVKPTYPNSNPTKPATDQYTYSFAGWATSANQETGTSASALPVVTADKTYFAAFSKYTKTYTVTINSGDHGSVSPSSVVVPYGTSISITNGDLVIGTNTITPDPDDGYKLSAWTEVPETVTGPLTVTAYFEIKTYTVTFTIEGGGFLAGNEITDVPHGSAISERGKSIYIDQRYVTAEPGNGRTLQWSYDSDTVTSDMIIRAICTPKQLTVAFSDTGNTALPNAIVTYGSRYSDGINWPSTPVKTGHTFAGWFTESEAQIDGDDTVSITSDTILYGHWTANQYTISFQTNGSSSIPDATIAYGQEYSQASGWPADPTKSGYLFGGWYLDSAFETLVTAHDPYTRTSDTTLYAKWDSQGTTYVNTVRFVGKAHDATGWPQDMSETVSSATAESAFTIPQDPVPTETGFTFVGWYVDGNTLTHGQTYSVSGGSTKVLTAVWGFTNRLVFEGNGSGISNWPLEMTASADSNHQDSEFTIPSDPTKSGSTFSYWKDSSNRHYYAGDKVTVSGGSTVRLTAVWTDDPEPTTTLKAVATVTPTAAYNTFHFNTNNSTGAVRVLWDFNDGSQTSTQRELDHTFTQPGTYQVKLTVYASDDSENSVTTPVTVTEPSQDQQTSDIDQSKLTKYVLIAIIAILIIAIIVRVI